MKTDRMTIRFEPSQMLKINALAATAAITQVEAVRALVDGHPITPKNSTTEATATPQNLAEIEGALAEMQASFAGLVDAVSTRLEVIETTLSDKLAGLSEIRRQQSQIIELLTTSNRTPAQPVAVPPRGGVFDDVPAQPVSGYPAQPVQSSPQAVDRPAFEDFLKTYPAPPLALPGSPKLLSHRQFVAKKYQEKFGVWPPSVPQSE